MGSYKYIVVEGNGSSAREIGEFREIDDALLFIEAYFIEYYAEPALRLGIRRVPIGIKDSEKDDNK